MVESFQVLECVRLTGGEERGRRAVQGDVGEPVEVAAHSQWRPVPAGCDVLVVPSGAGAPARPVVGGGGHTHRSSSPLR